ncbi:MAG: hypothetical protein R2849_22060 [Thermomicrobiales bacterium]
MPASRAETQEPMSPIQWSVDADVAVHLFGFDVDLDELLRLFSQVLPFPCDSSQLSRAPINITTSIFVVSAISRAG